MDKKITPDLKLNRRFIYFSEIMKPLNRLLKNGRKWEWTDKHEEAIGKIKGLLTTASILACTYFRHPFKLETVASATGLGAFLPSVTEGNQYVIAYASRGANEATKKYLASEKECLAVVWAIRKFGN